MTTINKFKPLESSRLVLRDFKESDLTNFVKYRSDPKISKFQSWETFTKEQGKNFLDEMKPVSFNHPGEYYQIAIELKESKEIIGDFMVHTLTEDPRQVEIGFTLDTSYQGKGYAFEGINNLLNFLFNDLNKHRIYAITDVRNEPSIKLLEKIGMRREGHFVKNIWFKGEWGSEFLYAILKEEWINL